MYDSINHIVATEILGLEDSKWLDPSGNMKHAWFVVEKMMSEGFEVLIRNCGVSDSDSIKDKGYFCNVFRGYEMYTVVAKTAPLAICLASCKALGINPYTAKITK